MTRATEPATLGYTVGRQISIKITADSSRSAVIFVNMQFIFRTTGLLLLLMTIPSSIPNVRPLTAGNLAVSW